MAARDTIIAFADKTVLQIEGLRVHGLRPCDLEKTLSEKLQTTVRVIGVTGESIEMDVYDLPPEAILKDEAGLIKAVSASEGIEASDVIRIASAKKAVPVDIHKLPDGPRGCLGERWRRHAAEEE
ncbi:MAG: hypothetical protein ACLFUS_08140 [Candidatus Sumerlaeia bacterium]